MGSQGSILELDIEEQLFHSLVSRSPEECAGLLSQVKDVDVRNSNQRTPLHVAVRVGRLDWVERLLMLGADPASRDRGNRTVLQAAEEMVTKHPEDAKRKDILRLVQLVYERECSRRASSTESEDASVAGSRGDTMVQGFSSSRLSQEIASFQGSVNEKLSEVMSKINVLSEDLVKLSTEITCIKENNGTSIKECLNAVNMLVASHSKGILSGPKTLDDPEKEVPCGKADGETTAGQLSMVKEVGDKVGKGLESWDKPLEYLEMMDFMEMKLKETEAGIQSSSGNIEGGHLNADERIRTQCIDAMMQKTQIMDVDYGKVSRVMGFYERLYCTSPLTSCILLYLQFQRQLKIMIDCDSSIIERIIQKYRDRSGEEHVGGGHLRSLADFSGGIVYAGVKATGEREEKYSIAFPGSELLKMSMHLAFQNSGRPYGKGDVERRVQYGRIITEAEREKMKGALEIYIFLALDEEAPIKKEMELISAVPTMLVIYGPVEGRSRLQQHLPSLLDFYSNHVLRTLSREAGVACSSRC